MSDNSNMVNVGTAEKPAFVPQAAVEPNTPRGEEYWQGVASGSIVPDDETLAALLNRIKNENS